jgi:hypothetical protein
MFFRANSPVVDLHWSLTPLYYSFTPPNDDLWPRAETVMLAGRTVGTLGPDDALLFFCLHGAKHSWSKLRWVCDLGELARARPDLRWDWILDWANRHGARRLVQIGLRLARDLVEAPIPDAALLPGKSDHVVTRIAHALRTELLAFPPRPEPAAEFPWRSRFFQSLDRSRDQARWIHEVILLPGELEWGLLPMPAVFAPLYFPVRLIRLGWKYTKKSLSGLRAGRA